MKAPEPRRHPGFDDTGGRDSTMGFGQVSGPPATARQLAELLALLQEAGHSDFRDARGPLGFTQRQAGGKFTRGEADELIERLQDEANPEPVDVEATRSPVRSRPAEPVRPAAAIGDPLSRVTTERLVAELRRRGWTAEAPPS